MADGVTFAATALSLLIPGSKIMKGVYAAFTFLAGKFIQTGVELTETAVNQNNIMFETFNVKGLFIGVQATLALYA
jgi:hypothetical protein